jgi:plasmid stabilization system protein ParE
VEVIRSPWFSEDVESYGKYYYQVAGEAVMEAFLEAVAETVDHLGSFPNAGVAKVFSHPELQAMRFVPLTRPFEKYLLFYRVHEGMVTAERLLHGFRNLPERLREAPGRE